jgi:hypothetical protein
MKSTNITQKIKHANTGKDPITKWPEHIIPFSQFTVSFITAAVARVILFAGPNLNPIRQFKVGINLSGIERH